MKVSLMPPGREYLTKDDFKSIFKLLAVLFGIVFAPLILFLLGMLIYAFC